MIRAQTRVTPGSPVERRPGAEKPARRHLQLLFDHVAAAAGAVKQPTQLSVIDDRCVVMSSWRNASNMSIFPLPVFEADADPVKRDAISDEERYAQLESPSTIVVRVGSMRRVAEYPYNGDAKPGCGSKMVARTHRGTELVEMLTTTCPNAGCGKAVTRAEMLDYIKASGGKDYPFTNRRANSPRRDHRGSESMVGAEVAHP